MRSYQRYSVTGSHVQRDEGLRQYMVTVYRYMSIALLLTAGVAFVASQSPSLMAMLFGTPMAYVVMFAPLIMVMWLGSRIGSMSVEQAQTSFWLYSAVMGLSLSAIFMIYTSVSIARAFFISASLFGTMSIYGQTTKRDLTGMGSFMIMGFFGILIASIVNIFLHSTMINFVVSVLGVIIFTGLTAYDTQRIKDSYYHMAGVEDGRKIAIFGALTLYLDFINLFMSLLRLFGQRK